MTDTFSRATRVSAGVQLEEIRLTESSSRATVRRPPGDGEVDVNVNFSADLRTPLKEDVFNVRATIETELTPSGGGEVVVYIKAVYDLKYRLGPNAPAPSTAELKSFAETNGIFHAWPYWREFIQSMFFRMNLPPFVLPVFRFADYAKRKSLPAARGESQQKEPVVKRK